MTNILKEIDSDTLIAAAWMDVEIAIKGWLAGEPRDEVALLNRLTERLARRRRGCDVGTRTPVTVAVATYLLHRKGPRQKDLFGADLAVTVEAPQHDFAKTALFQLKRCTGLRVKVETQQVKDGLRDAEIGDRSFVMAVEDQGRPLIRFRLLRDVNSGIKARVATTAIDCSNWLGFFEWIQCWLSCAVGVESDIRDPNRIENTLNIFVVTPSADRELPFPDEVDFSEELIPARAWLRVRLTQKDGDY